MIQLKNDSIIKGSIIEQVEGKAVKIKTVDNTILTFEMDEIKKISKGESPFTNTTDIKDRKPKASEFRDNGFGAKLNIGTSIIQKTSTAFNGTVGLGYIFDRNFSLFLGGGIDYYSYSVRIGTTLLSKNSYIMPLYVSCRYIILPGKVAPFIELGGGGASFNGDYNYLESRFKSTTKQADYGYYIRGQVGVAFLVSYGFMISLETGCNVYAPLNNSNILYAVPISLGFHF